MGDRGDKAALARAIEEGLFETAASGESPLAWALPAVRELFGCRRAAAHCIVQEPSGWDFDFFFTSGWDQATVDAYRAFVRTHAEAPTSYDPRRPHPSDRNRPKLFDELDFDGHPTAQRARDELLPALGRGAMDLLRVVVCDREVMLGWLGAYREEPFGVADKQLLADLVPAMRRALLVDRRLRDAGIAHLGLAAALDAMTTPAFVIDPRGAIAHANRAGRLALAHDRGELTARLERAVASQGAEDGAMVTRVVAPGVRPHALVVLSDDATTLRSRIEAARAAWRLTPRQTDVLRCLAAGDGNKTIAARLGCAEVTIEAHLTAVFRKAGAETRAQLLAKLHALSR